MVTVFKSLTRFNAVRFSAYRTAMKLRQVQKKLGCEYLVPTPRQVILMFLIS